MVVKANGIGPKMRYGLNFPHLVLVLSAIIPIIGSLIASHKLAVTTMIVATAGLMPSRSVKKNMIYIAIKLYSMF